MNRVNSNSHYLLIFLLAFVGIYSLGAPVQWLLREFLGYVIPAPSLFASLISVFVVTRHFRKHEGRGLDREERRQLSTGSFLFWLGLTLLFTAILLVVQLVAGDCLLYTSPSPRDRG